MKSVQGIGHKVAEAHRWDIRVGLKMSVDNARSLLITLVSSFTQPENGALLSIATTTRHGVINTEVYLRIHMAACSLFFATPSPL